MYIYIYIYIIPFKIYIFHGHVSQAVKFPPSRRHAGVGPRKGQAYYWPYQLECNPTIGRYTVLHGSIYTYVYIYIYVYLKAAL